MIVDDARKFALERFLPRHWKKRGVCHWRSCRKRRVHWHWVMTASESRRRFAKALKEIWEGPLIDALNAPNVLLACLEKHPTVPVGRPVAMSIGANLK